MDRMTLALAVASMNAITSGVPVTTRLLEGRGAVELLVHAAIIKADRRLTTATERTERFLILMK